MRGDPPDMCGQVSAMFQRRDYGSPNVQLLVWKVGRVTSDHGVKGIHVVPMGTSAPFSQDIAEWMACSPAL